ncbi:DNA polymerase-3 subunit gamma/tau [Sporobacter termitidis DSM 10068]|uniref:DNA-directed DNA polymerase n=1 Tax=Sporobacter termitidis DSM 10068 TaxID=1123282 RepID=A0A1M5Z5D4_9FIRM|nr:DNA polymerase III subunit gamma/tau [Sporobacter termitidis]SHI19318.1 DNA polymerase-3 subunit gamma/tau [Sporobacter termitidis DSM 10068]
MYQALYRKWRPKTFDDIVGQEHVSLTLKNQVVGGRLSHAYLFVGTRGTGKTTCAKILAKAVNCQNPQDGNPCNKCPSCLGIENGSILDVMELDAASNNGVDNVRALREEAVFTPVDVKKRVYIIDEVHMLSISAFNALLKILEEPPEHLIFILATTEIYKVPATILSRCQRFTFKRILPEKIAERLRYVAGQEGLTLAEDAAALLSRLSDGSLRDALSLLDQCASADVIDYGRVVSAIGLADSDEIAGLLAAVAGRDVAGALTVLDKLYMAGKVMASVIEALMNLVRDILVTSLMPGGGDGLLSGSFEPAVLDGFRKQFTAPQLLGMADILRETMLDISKGGGGRLSAELCLMRLCQDPGGVTAPVLPAGGASCPPMPPVRNDAAAQPVKYAPPESSPAAEAADKKAEISGAPKAENVPEAVPAPTEEPVPGPAPVPADGNAWRSILQLLEKKIDIPTSAYLSDPAIADVQFDGNQVIIRVKSDFYAKIINAPPVTAAVKEAAEVVLKAPAVVRVVTGGGSAGGESGKLDALKRFSNVKFE